MLYLLAFYSFLIIAYWLWFGISLRKIRQFGQISNIQQEGVSIIIAYKNEGEKISLLVQKLLNQNYPTFEIIAIDDFSIDKGSDALLSIHNLKLINLKATYDQPGKKVALTQAIEKAKYPFLLFTDGDCIPESDEWISSMMAVRADDTDVVCGYAPHTVNSGWLGVWQQFETWMTAMQYMTYAITGLPYMAVGRNMLVKKSSFEKVDGYSRHADVSSGDDDLLIQSIATSGIVTPYIDPPSWMISPAKSTLNSYLHQKTRHVGTSVHYHWKHQFLLSMFAGLQFMFWTLVVIILVTQPTMWSECLIIILFKWLVQMICHHQWAIRLRAKKLQWYFPILDLSLPIYYVMIALSSITSRKTW